MVIMKLFYLMASKIYVVFNLITLKIQKIGC